MKNNDSLPSEKTLDSTLALINEGYLFIQNRCKQFDSNIFQTRLFCQNVICLSGEELAKLFYDNEKFIRKGALPKRIQKTLTGENGVQTLDEKAHQHRKAMFMSLMSQERLKSLVEITNEKWDKCSRKWSNKVILFDEAQLVMCKVACTWAGVPLTVDEEKLRAEDFGKMVDAFGAVGLRHWKGRVARKRAEKWIEDIIKQIRNKELKPSKESAAFVIAHHQADGKLLPSKVAAVELINILRPIVAIATYIAFEALALQEYPEWKIKLQSNNLDYEAFVQEVRRYYPFAPFVGARVKKDFKWNNYQFNKGTLVLLDIYGTNHDENIWEKPHEFNPERFVNQISPYSFIPHGGGDYYTNHRCAGEWVTIEIMKASLNFLVNKIAFEVPKQDLSYSLARIPTLPNDKIIIDNIKIKA